VGLAILASTATTMVVFLPVILMTEDADAFEPIGISCRICERKSCPHRSVPPLERQLRVDPNERGMLPYQLD
jgi:predicted transcriptional regulator